MKWVDLAVKPNFSWPKLQVEIPFEGRRIVLQPPSDELCCAVSVFDKSRLTLEVGGNVLSRFLSRLAWTKNGGVVELFICGSNNPARPGLLGQGHYEKSNMALVEPWDNIYMPTALSADAELALALYREGMSVNSVPFAFLSYFKVLNITFSSGSSQKDWINQHLSRIWYPPALGRIQALSQQHSNVGAYLYEQGRCAVAHANGVPLVNPDNYGDRWRLKQDLPLMKEIAALFIEQELFVPSDSAYWKLPLSTNTNAPDPLKRTRTEDGRVVYVPIAHQTY